MDVDTVLLSAWYVIVGRISHNAMCGIYKNCCISLKLSNTESCTDALKEPEEIHTD
jgi:hypothetical protein